MEEILNVLLQSGLIFTMFFVILWGVNRLLVYFKILTTARG